MVVGLLITALLAVAIGLLWPIGDQRWCAGTFRLHGLSRWLPLYVSPVMTHSSRCGWPWRPGIAVGTFGRAAYVARLEKH